MTPSSEESLRRLLQMIASPVGTARPPAPQHGDSLRLDTYRVSPQGLTAPKLGSPWSKLQVLRTIVATDAWNQVARLGVRRASEFT